MSTGAWSAHAVQATTFLDRFRGLHALTADDSLLIQARSIHTLGLGRPVEVVVVDRDLVVSESTTLGPNRVFVRLPAWYMLELPVGSALPALRSRLEITDA